MPRKGLVRKIEVGGDPHFNSVLVAKFMNCMMWSGKKGVARHIFYGALDEIRNKMPDQDPFEVFKQAIENVKPRLEVKPKRIGGAVYQIPMEVKQNRQIALAFRWLLSAARNKKGSTMAQKLANELTEASKEQGAAIKKKEDTHRMAEANKAFAHLAKY